MKSLFLNLSKAVVASLVLVIALTVIPNSVFGQNRHRMNDNCPVRLTVATSPTEVKAWNVPVKITTTISPGPPYLEYCSTREVANLKIQYRPSNSTSNEDLRSITLTLQPNETGAGQSTSTFDSASFDFSRLGVPENASNVIVIAGGALTRHAGFNQTTQELVSQPVTIRLNVNSTVPQDTGTTPGETPPINPTTPGQTPGETTTPPKPIENPNTDVGIKVDPLGFDHVLGTFFNPLEDDRPEQILVRIINILLTFAAVLAVIFIIVGGLMMVTSAGNENRIKNGKQTLIYAVLGLILTLLSFSIVAIIQTIIAR